MRYFFARLDEKHQLLGNFEKILKTFDKNSIGKLNFQRVLEKLLLKIEPSEITPFFYNNSFDFGGGDVPCVPPWRRLWYCVADGYSMCCELCSHTDVTEPFIYTIVLSPQLALPTWGVAPDNRAITAPGFVEGFLTEYYSCHKFTNQFKHANINKDLSCSY